MRINKFLASIGVASRRKVDELIAEGRVQIDSRIAKLGDQVDPEKEKVTVDGELVGDKQKLVYIALNKPKGYTSTTAKIKGEKNILELISSHQRLYPVGRLDRDTSGLILLTNDGDFAQRVTHPKYHLPKTYEVTVLGNITDDQLEKLRGGIELEEGITQPAEVKIVSKSLPRHSTFTMTLFEGKKRQIRRMAAYLHLHILDLKRISIGSIKLGNLSVGKYRELTKEELEIINNRQ